MKQFNFARLLERYAVDYDVIQMQEGSYIDGEYVPGEETKETGHSPIIPLSAQKVLSLGGSYTTKDKQLYRTEPLDWTRDCRIRYQGREYQPQEDADYGDYAGVYIYLLKWVEQLDQSKRDNTDPRKRAENGLPV